jgi:hypothetical protein
MNNSLNKKGNNVEFKEYLTESEKSMTESAQIKLELVTKINALMGSAEIGDLKKIVKILEKVAEE